MNIARSTSPNELDPAIIIRAAKRFGFPHRNHASPMACSFAHSPAMNCSCLSVTNYSIGSKPDAVQYLRQTPVKKALKRLDATFIGHGLAHPRAGWLAVS